MTVATFIVAVAAVLISAGALLLNRRADLRAENNEKRLTGQEEREKRREQREEAAASLAQTANLHADYIGEGKPGPRAYRFRVHNSGQQAASHLVARLVDRHGNDVTSKSIGPGTGTLDSGGSGDYEVSVSLEALSRNPLFLKFIWRDTGPDTRSYVSKVEVPES
jgi:hypothetical protein